MSETNGQGWEARFDRMKEELERVTASHVKLMTDHEVAWAKHEKFVAAQDHEWARQQELWKQNELAHQRFLAADEALGKRIDDLVSGMGEFISRVTDALERKR